MVLKRGRTPKTVARAELETPTPRSGEVASLAAPSMVAAPTAPSLVPEPVAAESTAPEAAAAGPRCPRLYYLHPAMVGPLPAWDAAFAHAAGMGFDGVLLPPIGTPGGSGHLFQLGDPDRPHPALGADGDTPAVLAALAEKARGAGVALFLDLVLDRAASDGRLVAEHPEWFAAPLADAPLDPRQVPAEQGIRAARLADEGVASALGDWWETRLRAYAAAGVAGFRCDAPARVPAPLWKRFTAALPECRFLAWTPGLPARDLRLLADAGFAATLQQPGVVGRARGLVRGGGVPPRHRRAGDLHRGEPLRAALRFRR